MQLLAVEPRGRLGPWTRPLWSLLTFSLPQRPPAWSACALSNLLSKQLAAGASVRSCPGLLVSQKKDGGTDIFIESHAGLINWVSFT